MTVPPPKNAGERRSFFVRHEWLLGILALLLASGFCLGYFMAVVA